MVKAVPYVVQSPAAFVQYVASNLLPWGYRYVVTGQVKPGQSPEKVDRALIKKFDCNRSRGKIAYRKSLDQSSIRYIRYADFWVMLSTKGKHPEVDNGGRDCFSNQAVSLANGGRLHFQGYSIRLVRDDAMAHRGRRVGYRSHVSIGRNAGRELLAEFLEISTKRSVEELRRRIYTVPFEPYAPVIERMREILYRVNRKRKSAGLCPIEPDCIRVRRKSVQVFSGQYLQRHNESQKNGAIG